MKHPNRSDKEARALLDLASEEIMSLSDEEVRARADDSGVDIKAQGEAFRRLLQVQTKTTGIARLHRARQEIEAREKSVAYSAHSLPMDRVKARLSELFESGLVDPNSRLTLAFRSGKEMNDDDMRSLLADCEELLAKSLKDR